MYKRQIIKRSTIGVNTSIEGETIEQKIERIVNNKEPITDGAPPIYTERKDGVIPAYNVRTDRFELAVEAMDIVDKGNKARREAKVVPFEKGDGKAEPTQGQGDSTGGSSTTE